MPKNKTSVEYEIESDQQEWLADMTTKYGLASEAKTLRVLLDFAMQDADERLIFSDENTRCRHCA
jgi:hypothetical protein